MSMAEVKVDLVEDHSKDQATSENSIPLSPQWLYAKPAESKDIRQLLTLQSGSVSDNIQKDLWRLDGSQDKKEWRRNVPDMDSSRRWRDEERDTGLLARRERRKEGDREAEYRKGDRRSESNSREAADSRTLPSFARNSVNEVRRDSKWSSRWGPEDKDKDSRTERKADADKDDHHVEKPSLSGANRSLMESDSRDKWRPRHRQEGHSGGSSVYRAAPGFGLERGRVEGSIVGFSLGRGRANTVAVLPFSRPFSTGLIGAAPASMKSGLSPDTFLYPRGKLLDIYRKQKMLPHFDKTPGDLENVPPITQSNSTLPLAFVTPVAEEETVLDDISRGKIISSEVCNLTPSEKVARVDASTDVRDITLSEKKEMPQKISAYCDVSLNEDVDPLDDLICSTGEDSKVNPVIHGEDSGGMVAITSENDGFSGERVLKGISTNSELLAIGNTVLDEDHGGHHDYRDKLEGRNLIDSFDDSSSKLPDDSNSLFDASIFEDIPSNCGQYQTNNEVNKLVEPFTTPEELTLLYRDPQGDIQDAPGGTSFQPLGELMPHLRSNFGFTPVHSGKQSEPSDTAKGNLKANIADSDFPASAMNGQQQTSFESDGALDPHAQGRDSSDGSQNIHFGRQDAEDTGRLGSSSDNSFEKLASEHRDLSLDHSGHQFMGSGQPRGPNMGDHRTTDNNLNPLGLLWSELEGTHPKQPLSSKLTSIGDHITSPVGIGENSLFRQEQEQFSMIGDSSRNREAWSDNYRRNTTSHVLLDAMDSSQFAQFEQEVDHFNLEEHLLLQQQQQLLQKQKLLQKQQQLQQQSLKSHENMHMTIPFVEQVQGLLQRQNSMNHPVPDLEQHLLKLRLQEHLQQMQQEQQLQQLQQQQRQQQIHHHMQLMQQKQQEAEEQLLYEHLLQQQIHDTGLGATHVDQVLFRQQLLRQTQQQAHHVSRHYDPSIEQLIQAKFGHNLRPEHHEELLQHQLLLELRQNQLARHNGPLLPAEQLLFDLQQEQLQAQQFSFASRQQLAMDEESNHGVWSVDESGQFIRTTVSPHHSHAARVNQLDYLETVQRPSSFEQPSHLERIFGIHERSQRGNFERNCQPFGMPDSISAGTPGTNIENVNTLARLQGLELGEMHGQMHSSGYYHRGQIPSGSASNQHRVPNDIFDTRLDAMENHWSQHDGQLHGRLIDAHINQLHLHAEKQKRDMEMNISGRESNSWTLPVGNDGTMNPGLAGLLHDNLVLQSSPALELDGSTPASYEHRDPSRLFSRLTSDHPFTDSSVDTSLHNEVGRLQQDHVMYTNKDIYETSASLSSRSNSGALFKNKQLFLDMDDIEKEQFADSVVGDASVGRMDLLDLKTGEGVKKHGSKENTNRVVMDFEENGIEQVGGSVIDHGELQVSAPIRHASFGSSGGGINFYNYDMGVGNAYNGDMVNDRVTGILSRGTDVSGMKTSPRGVGPELSSAPSVKGKNPTALAPSEEGRRESGGNPSENTSTRRKGVQFRQSSSADTPEASFIDMLKSTKKTVPPETEASSETHKGGSSKKKGKKGRQIDPSLLGFKVHSNRIMMGEIQRPDDS